MIKITTTPTKTLNILLKDTNKALSKVLENLSTSELGQITKTPKELSELLTSFFKNNTTPNLQQNQTLLQLLKNNPTFKELANVQTTLKSLQKNLENIEEPLPKTQKLQTTLKALLKDMPHIKADLLKTRVENSGVFLESKLKNNTQLKETLTNDLKTQLMQTKEELQNTNGGNKPLQTMQHIEKLSLQIDYYQLLSHLSNASVLYLPYSFEGLQEGSVTIKKAKQNHYFCDIDLQLKNYGLLHMRLGLFEKKQLRIYMECENDNLRTLLEENLTELKKMLFSVGIEPKEIRFLEKNKNLYNEYEDINLGFEVKI